jgi:GT2 family glycosyltransferase
MEAASGRHTTADPRVAIVLATHNRVREVMRTVQRLLQLPERPSVVVVDNGSSDGTSAALRAGFPAVTCLTLGANLGAAGRNIGASATNRPYVAFCDDDTCWQPGRFGARPISWTRLRGLPS